MTAENGNPTDKKTESDRSGRGERELLAACQMRILMLLARAVAQDFQEQSDLACRGILPRVHPHEGLADGAHE